MVGELSEDGNWIWDGDNWVPHATEEASPQMNEPSELRNIYYILQVSFLFSYILKRFGTPCHVAQ